MTTPAAAERIAWTRRLELRRISVSSERWTTSMGSSPGTAAQDREYCMTLSTIFRTRAGGSVAASPEGSGQGEADGDEARRQGRGRDRRGPGDRGRDRPQLRGRGCPGGPGRRPRRPGRGDGRGTRSGGALPAPRRDRRGAVGRSGGRRHRDRRRARCPREQRGGAAPRDDRRDDAGAVRAVAARQLPRTVPRHSGVPAGAARRRVAAPSSTSARSTRYTGLR